MDVANGKWKGARGSGVPDRTSIDSSLHEGGEAMKEARNSKGSVRYHRCWPREGVFKNNDDNQIIHPCGCGKGVGQERSLVVE